MEHTFTVPWVSGEDQEVNNASMFWRLGRSIDNPIDPTDMSPSFTFISSILLFKTIDLRAKADRT